MRGNNNKLIFSNEGVNLKEEIMKDYRILICDEDESYLDALTKYLISAAGDLDIKTYSKKDLFKEADKNVDLRLMTSEFIKELAPYDKNQGKIFQLLGSDDEQLPNVDHIYKFQRMTSFVDKLGILEEKRKRRSNNSGARIMGIISPTHHNMTIPFSMVYSKICRQEGKVLFIDLSHEMDEHRVNIKGKRNITDFLYSIDNPIKEEIEIGKYVENYEGIYYMMPATDPEELWEVEKEQWEVFIGELRNSNYDVVIIAFGEYSKNFYDIVDFLDELMLVGEDEEYSKKRIVKFQKYLMEKGVTVNNQIVYLPSKICEKYKNEEIKEILKGNLSEWIRGIERMGRGALNG